MRGGGRETLLLRAVLLSETTSTVFQCSQIHNIVVVVYLSVSVGRWISKQ